MNKKLKSILAKLKTDNYYPDESNDQCQKHLLKELKVLLTPQEYSKVAEQIKKLDSPSNLTLFEILTQG